MSIAPFKYRRAPLAAAAVTLVLLTALSIAAAAPAAARGPAEGTEILVTGVVTDSAGNPVAGVSVELEATRRAFSMRDFRVRQRAEKSVATITDETGSFEIPWEWHPYYNRFELRAGVRVGLAGGSEELVVLERTDLSQRMRQGSPVVATFALADVSLVESMRDFLSQADSADEQQVYHEMGKPDKVRLVRLAEGEETGWWYFAAGRVYWFRNGLIDSVDEFEPISSTED